MKVSVLGCGRWGSFLAWYQASVLKNDVVLYGEEGRVSFEQLKKEGKNQYVELDERIKLSSDLGYALDFAEVVIISISSQALREFMKKVSARGIDGKIFVLCMKGIEVDTGKRLSQVMVESGVKEENVAVWVGPGHIQEFTRGVPNCMIIDGANADLKKSLVQSFKSDLIRFYYGDDLIGTEVGAAAKNVMGIAAGVLDGCGLSSLKGPLMARGAYEVANLIGAMGGNFTSAYGLAHLGDYETTLFSPYSNNRKYGELMARGEKFDKLAEGVTTSKAMVALGKKYGVELPITQAVYEGCYVDNIFAGGDGAKACLNVVAKMFERSVKSEFRF